MKNNCRMPLDVQQHFRERVLWTLYQQPTSSNFSSIVSLPFFHDPRCIFCCMRPCKSSYVGKRTVNHRWAKRWASKQWIKSFCRLPPTVFINTAALQRWSQHLKLPVPTPAPWDTYFVPGRSILRNHCQSPPKRRMTASTPYTEQPIQAVLVVNAVHAPYK